MTKEDIIIEIKHIAQEGAFEGCNLEYIEREAENLAERIIDCDHRYHSRNGRYMLYDDYCEKCGKDIGEIY